MTAQETVTRTPVREADLEYYFDRLLPKVLPSADPKDPEDCAIKQRHVYIYGRMDRGKGNTAKWIVNEAIARYGRDRVSVDQADATAFHKMLNSKWDRKDVAIKVIDDAVNVGIPQEDLHTFFTIRHVMQEKTGFREGLCVTVMNVQRLHDSPVALRSDYDSLLILSVPAKGSWDRNFMANQVGEEALLELQRREEESELDPTGAKKGYMLVTYEDRFLGITKLPRIHAATKIRVIEPDLDPPETQSNSRKKSTTNSQVEKLSLRKRLPTGLLMIALILAPWLSLYGYVKYPQSALIGIVLWTGLSASYVAFYVRRWLFKVRR